MLTLIFTALLFGLSAGFSPCPLTVLVISETMRHNVQAGKKAGLAPLICDAPIILLTLLVIAKFSNTNLFLAGVSFIGAIYITFLGFKNLQTKPLEFSTIKEKEKSLQKGIIVNFLNPHPYLFWLTVGAPILVKASLLGWPAPVLFLFCFYSVLVGSKFLIAYIAGTSRRFFTGNFFLYLNKFMGILLILFAILLVKDGIVLMYN